MFKVYTINIFSTGDTIKNKILRLTVLTFILFITIGIVSAGENNTTPIENFNQASSYSPTLADDGSFDEIKDMIDNAAENDTVKLEGKIYGLSGNREITLNKSLNFEGSDGTVIDGNNSSLYFSCVEKKKQSELGFGICRTGYEIKNTGKHITLKNITFTNINIIEWHKMDFIDCNFINSTVTNYELDNTYKNSVFINSTIETKTPQGWLPDNYTADCSKIEDCEFKNSNIISSNLFLSTYIAIVGGSRFELINTVNINGCNFSKSKLELTYYTINIEDCLFTDGTWKGGSSNITLNSSSLSNLNIDYFFPILNAQNSYFINDTMSFRGGYFSSGNRIAIENCELDDCELKIDEGMNSRKSALNIIDSSLNSCFIDSKFTDITINDTNLDKTKMHLLHTKNIVKNTNLTSDENLSEIFKNYNSSFDFEKCYLINGSEKTELDVEDIDANNIDELLIDEKESYSVGDKLIVTIIDSRGNPLEDECIYIKDLSTNETSNDYSDENGTVKYALQKSGKVKLLIFTPEPFGAHIYSKIIELNVSPIPISITAPAITTTYGNRGNLKIKLNSNETNSTLDGFKLTVKVFTGKKYKKYTVITKSNGTATLKTRKNLAVGKHKVTITTGDSFTKKTTITVNKIKTTVKAPKVTNKFKKSKYFKVAVKDKATKKAVSNVKVKLKVFTGKKYITKTIKTNSKGIAKLNTKFLKIGSHKVVISSANGNYKISAKSKITIR